MMKKRLLSILLILVMCMGSIPMTLFSVSAEKAGAIYVAGVLMNDGEYLANGASAVQASKPSKGYAFYKDGILTLHNYEYSGKGYSLGSNNYAMILSYTNLRIVLEGKNVLVGSFPGSSICGYGIKATFSLYISGEGDLTLNSKDGIYTDGGIRISNTDISIRTAGTGISADEEIYIYKSDITIDATHNAIHSMGGDIHVVDSSLFAYSDLQMTIYTPYTLHLIYCNAQLRRGNESYALISASEIDAPVSAIWASTSTDIIEMSKFEKYDPAKKSVYNLIVIVDAYESAYVYVGGIKMTKGTYLVSNRSETTKNKPESGGYAHFDGKVLTLNNFSYHGNGHISKYQIYSDYALEIVLEGNSTFTHPGASIYGIYTQYDLYIHGSGTLNITNQYALYAYKSIYVKDVTLNFHDNKRGINSEEQSIEITNASVSSRGMYGISSYDSIKISGSYIDVSVDNDGLYANSVINIDDSYIDIRSNNTSRDDSYMAIFASEYIYFSNQANVVASTYNSNTDLVNFKYSECMTYDYVCSTRAVLNYIDIVNIALPETWALPDFSAKADSGYTEIVDIKWYELDSNGDLSKELIEGNSGHYFYDKKSYRVYVTVRAFKGKEFGDVNLSAWIGDKSVQSYSTSTANAKERVLYRDFVASENPGNYTITLGNFTLKDGEYLADNGTAVTTTKPSGGYAYYSNGMLTLNNFKSKNPDLRFTESYLRIQLYGSNKLASINDNSLNDDKPYELQIYGDSDGNGYIYVNGMGNSDGSAFNVSTAIYLMGGMIDLDDELYGFNTETLWVEDAEVYCYVSQGGAFYGECDLYVKSGSFRVFDGGGWNQNINDSVNIKKGDVYVSNDGSGDPNKADLWDGVTSLNAYEDVWVLPESNAIYVDGIKLKNKQYLAVGAEHPSATKPTSGGYAYFETDGETNILTLNNYSLSTESSHNGIHSDYDLTIKLVGNNTIEASKILYYDALYVLGTLTIEGTGKLTAIGYDSVYAVDFIMNSGTLTCDAYDDGISTYNDITINGGEIIISSGDDAITVNGDVYMNGGKLTISNAYCCAVNAYNFYMTDGEFVISSEEDTDGLYINGTIDISGGSVTVTGDGDYIRYAFRCDELILSDCYIEIYAYDMAIEVNCFDIAADLNPMASANMNGSGAVAFDADDINSYKYFTCGSAYAKGDVNGDGKVNLFDYVAVKSHVLGKSLLDSDQQSRADLNGDGRINMFDYVALKTLVVKG